MNIEMDQQSSVYRKMLAAAISSILMEYGCDSIEKECLGTLTEMLQACKYLSLLPPLKIVEILLMCTDLNYSRAHRNL